MAPAAHTPHLRLLNRGARARHASISVRGRPPPAVPAMRGDAGAVAHAQEERDSHPRHLEGEP
eukprot:scaffold20159_cov90-Isochrysis_galbana.AAC.1